jgi:hypothetical protein
VFGALTCDGELAARLDDSDWHEGQAQTKRPTGSCIEYKTREVWRGVTADLRLNELASSPLITELGPAVILYRFVIEHPDARRWTDVEIARTLRVTDRTIRNYRQKVATFVKKYLF